MSGFGWLPRIALTATACFALGAAPAARVIANIGLAKPFAARSPWVFTASQGPEIDDPVMGEGKVPGEIRLCLRKAPSAPCDRALREALRKPDGEDLFAAPHYLTSARVVGGAAAGPLLWVQTASLYGVNGDHLNLSQALAYRRATDRFERVYELTIGANNNQDVRFIETGALKGRIVATEPTEDAPFGYWVTVSGIGASGAYRQILRFRSATIYGDGNRLSVIDSEMPNIQRRLGLWKPGQPLPLPPGGCSRPHLVKTALWCE